MGDVPITDDLIKESTDFKGIASLAMHYYLAVQM